MSHNYHEALPGYHADQLLVDGCHECETRAKSADHGINNLDPVRFRQAWVRARLCQQRGLPNISNAELPMLNVLAAIDVQVRHSGVASFADGVALEDEIARLQARISSPAAARLLAELESQFEALAREFHRRCDELGHEFEQMLTGRG